MEQFGNNRCHSAEMSRTEFAAQLILQVGRFDVIPLFHVRIEFFLIGCEYHGNTLGFQLVRILLQRTRIFVEIFALTKLQAVDENTDYNAVRPFFRLTHKREMSFMQIAHGRHKCHLSRIFTPRAQFSNGMYDLHYGNPYFTGLLPDDRCRLYAPYMAKQNAV